MSTEQFANNAQTNLNGAITAGATSLTVASASGFPASAQFRIKIDNELMLVTAMSGVGNTTWTVTRDIESTTAAPHADQATVTQVLTAGGLENLDASYIGTGQLALARGGTGADLSGTGGTGQYVKQSSAGAPLSVGTIPGSDVPNLDASKITTGILPIARGGTNSGTTLNNNRLMESSGGAIVEGPALTNGQLLIGNTGNAPSAAGLTTGTGISVANGAGSITVSGSIFVASGSSHSAGDVPDPGGTAGTTRFLREDATWAVPPGGGGVTTPDGGVVQVINGVETGVPAPLNVCEGRMTLTSGTPITNSDVTAATTVYFTPSGDGSRVALYDGTRWKYFSFSEISIKLTDSSQTGNTASGSAMVTNLTDTSQLVRGMQVSGTGIPANTTISSINSATQITLSANATATGTGVALTFKLPNGNNYDVWAVISGSTAKLQFGNAWTNSTTRADAISQQDGVWVNTSAVNGSDSNAIAAKQGRLLGTIRTTSTAGQTEDSLVNRLLANIYHAVPRILRATPGYNNNNAQTTWTTNSTTWTNANGGTGNQVNFVIPLSGGIIDLTGKATVSSAANGTSWGAGIGIDSNTSPVDHGGLAAIGTAHISYRDVLSLGYHFAALLVRVAANTLTFDADEARNGAAADPRSTFMEGWVMG